MRLHIFGASGSGVTSLGFALSKRLSIPYFDSDEYFWEKSDPPFTVRRDPWERNSLINEDLKAEQWIFGGSSMNWSNVFPDFDLIIFLWIPSEIRIQRLKEREFIRYGEIIFTDHNRNKQFEEFIEWATDYDHNTGISNRTLVAHEKWLLTKHATPVLEIRGDTTIDERIELIIQRLRSITFKREV